jgi:FtsP/CotA-like multicopper oxidase with cupredoxin domain
MEKLTEGQAARARQFTLTMDHSQQHGMHQINGKTFEIDSSDYRIPFGETEIWEIRNMAEGMHSMHVHGTHFQVLDRNGAAPTSPVDFGWKDTVLVNDFEVVRVILRFHDYRGRYMFHCHFLEHEDDGMMVNIDVV